MRFDERLLHCEDWDFLLSLWAAGAQFQFLAETVSEYRAAGDGRTRRGHGTATGTPDGEFGRVREKARAIARATENGLARFQREMLDFDWSETRRSPGAAAVARAAHDVWIENAKGS